VRGTAHDLSVDERSRRRGPSETKCMSSARYEGAWPDNDEKTKHASLKLTHRWTGSQCNWRNTGEMWSPRLVPVKSRRNQHLHRSTPHWLFNRATPTGFMYHVAEI